MGHELYRMIRDGAPAGWTPDMRLLAGVIADDARDPSQGGPPGDGGWPWSAIPVSGYYRKGKWIDGITERTGMKRRMISRTLTDLARAGYEMREVVGRGKDGRVVFTTTGHSMRFRVPPLAPRDPPERSPDKATGRAAKRSPDTATGRRGTARQIQHDRSPNSARPLAKSGDPVSPGLPQVSPPPEVQVVNSNLEGGGRAAATADDSDSQDPYAILAEHGVEGERAKFIVARIEAQPRFGPPAAYLAKMVRDGKIGEVIDRADRARGSSP